MTASLKDSAINSMLWVTIDKTGSYLLLFVSNLVLARLLMPEDFGCIAMLNVFFGYSRYSSSWGGWDGTDSEKESYAC